MLTKANKELFDKLKSFYFEISRYRKWLDEDELSQFARSKQDS